MHVFFKEFLLFIALAALCMSSNSMSARTGRGGCLAKGRQVWTGEGRGLKTSKNVRKSCIDDPLVKPFCKKDVKDDDIQLSP